VGSSEGAGEEKGRREGGEGREGRRGRTWGLIYRGGGVVIEPGEGKILTNFSRGIAGSSTWR